MTRGLLIKSLRKWLVLSAVSGARSAGRDWDARSARRALCRVPGIIVRGPRVIMDPSRTEHAGAVEDGAAVLHAGGGRRRVSTLCSPIRCGFACHNPTQRMPPCPHCFPVGGEGAGEALFSPLRFSILRFLPRFIIPRIAIRQAEVREGTIGDPSAQRAVLALSSRTPIRSSLSAERVRRPVASSPHSQPPPPDGDRRIVPSPSPRLGLPHTRLSRPSPDAAAPIPSPGREPGNLAGEDLSPPEASVSRRRRAVARQAPPAALHPSLLRRRSTIPLLRGLLPTPLPRLWRWPTLDLGDG